MSAVYQLVFHEMGGAAIQDVTAISYDKKGSYRLNRPTVWTFRVPSTMVPGLRKGWRLRVRRNGVCVANLIVMVVRREGLKNRDVWAYVTAVDPMIWWPKRPLRDETGDFSRPIFTGVTTATLGQDAPYPLGSSVPTYRPISGAELIRRGIAASQEWEGTLWLEEGTFQEAVPPAVDLGIDDLVDWPITLADLSSSLVNTGMIDIVIDPVDGTGDLMGMLNVYNQAGSDLTNVVHLDYAIGNFGIDEIIHTEDLETLCNRLWYYLGPPQGVQRYKANITADRRPPNPPSNPDRLNLPNPPQDDLDALIAASRDFYGVAMDVRIYDSGNEFQALMLHMRNWQTEVLLRVNGQELLSVKPKPDAEFLPFDDYNPGDIIAINSGEALGIEFENAAQRIYGFDVEPDKEGVERVGQLIVSADQG